jgi:hypothetical protein
VTEVEARWLTLRSRGKAGEGDAIIAQFDASLPCDTDPFFKERKQGEASMLLL